jgi:Lrp/AsnC family transcriptional regulator, leucine-responsive regulatory protein
MPPDRKDLLLLAELQRDGRVANSALAARVGLSESACLNAAKLGIGVGLLVRITLKSQVDRELKAFETAVRAVPEVVECYLTTGESDYVLRVVARSAEDIERIHSKVLTKLPGVARVESSFVLREVTRGAALPLG